MILLENITLSFGGNDLLKDASFSLHQGEKIGLVGRNGTGKSTLLKLINHELEPCSGNVKVSKNYKLGTLSQHISFTENTVLDEAIKGLSQEKKDEVYKAEKILSGLGFTEEDFTRSPHLFSGGYQLRIELAKVLLSEPDCLLLDEPTNYLDLLSIRWLCQFLKRWPHEMILISHDREFMDSVTSHTLGIYRQDLVKLKGTTIDFYKKILETERLHETSRQNKRKDASILKALSSALVPKPQKQSRQMQERNNLKKSLS